MFTLDIYGRRPGGVEAASRQERERVPGLFLLRGYVLSASGERVTFVSRRYNCAQSNADGSRRRRAPRGGTGISARGEEASNKFFRVGRVASPSSWRIKATSAPRDYSRHSSDHSRCRR